MKDPDGNKGEEDREDMMGMFYELDDSNDKQW